jgi:hypothetical protein
MLLCNKLFHFLLGSGPENMLCDIDDAFEPLFWSCVLEIKRKIAARPKNSTNGDHNTHMKNLGQ